MTIGDVLAAVALLVVIGLSWGCLLLLTVLIFPVRTMQIESEIQSSVGKCLMSGIMLFLGCSVFALLMIRTGMPLLKLLGDATWVILLLLSTVGVGGIVRLIGKRIESYGTQMSPFITLTRAVIFSVCAGFLPLIGWFILFPLVTLVGLGSILVTCLPAKDTSQTEVLT